jgi:hypothetical protein
MWAMVVFLVIGLAGIAFLLCFLGALIGEQSATRAPRVHRLTAAPGEGEGMTSRRSPLIPVEPVASLRVVWKFGADQKRPEKEPSCGISSSC